MNTSRPLHPIAVRALTEGALNRDDALVRVLEERAHDATLTGAATLVSVLAKPGKRVTLPLLAVAAQWILAVEARYLDAWATENRASLWLQLERLTPDYVWTHAGDLSLMGPGDVDCIRDRVLARLATSAIH